jgi:fatty-acyl-CoA synthase
MNLLDNLKDDIVFMRGAYRALRMTTPIARHPTRVFPAVIEELAERFGDAPALISDREQLSYRGLSERANRYARWARREGLGKGEAVCLLMPNRPEYMAVWIGIISAGGVAALINTNLIGTALAHCIDIAAPKHVIVAAECTASFAAAQTLMKTRPKVWAHGDGAEAGGLGPRLDREIDAPSRERPAATERATLTIEYGAI